MKSIILYIFLGVFSFATFAQKYNLKDPVPMDTAIRTGVLKNGMTYYILHNEKPKARASFYFIQNVGGILENDDQDGLAHFLEHMAFNGTKHFPGKNLLNLLEKNGVKFGKDINAYTAKNETVYNLDDVPVLNNGLVDSCLLILSDWSQNLLLTTEEINAERGVISEEWRTRRNSHFRIQEKLGPTIFNGSKYAYRDVIGDLNVIKNFDPETLRSFYHDWYRTDLQAIAVVGDVNVDEIEAKIKNIFSALHAVENPKPRPFVEIPDNDKPLFAVATDPDLESASVSMTIRKLVQEENNLENIRINYLNGCFNSLFAARLREIVQNGDAPFLGGEIKIASLERGYKALNVKATAKDGQEEKAFEAVYSELQRVVQHGFTNSEFDRVIKMMLLSLENSYKMRGEITNNTYCKTMKSAFLSQSNLSDAEFTYKFIGDVLRSLKVEEISALAVQWLTPQNRVYFVVGPENWKHLNENQLLSVVDRVDKTTLPVYVDNVPVGNLLGDKTPVGGKIVQEKKNKLFGNAEWTLSNGAKVIYKKLRNETEMVMLSGYSDGGASLYSSKDLPNAVNVPDFVSSYGLGNFSAIELKKLLTGNSATCTVGIDTYEERLTASATLKDVETMFQLVYMRFENPRFDRDIFSRRLKENYDKISMQDNKQNIMKDTMESIMMNNHPRRRKVDKSYLDDLNFERMEEIYRERFTDASDFTFVLAGNIDEELARKYVTQYLGSITDIDRNEKWVDHHVDFPKGKTRKDIVIPISTNKSSVLLRMNMNAPYTRKNIISQTILASILKLRFTEEIREKEGGTYGVDVKPGVARIPNEQMSLAISFDCDPTKAKYLRSLVYRELDNIQKKVNQEDLNKVVLNLKKDKGQVVKDLKYWSGVLVGYYKFGDNRLDSSYFDDVIDKITVKDIQKTAKVFFKKADVVDVIFYPETTKNE